VAVFEAEVARDRLGMSRRRRPDAADHALHSRPVSVAQNLIAGVAAVLLAACSGEKSSAYQGYVEGEYVNVASAVAGRLDKLLVQRGQTVEAKAPLFRLETEQELAAKQQTDEQLNAAQAQLADLKLGRRQPEVAVTQAQLAQAEAALEQATLQLRRDEAQFDAGGIAKAQLEDSRANQAIKAARVRELSGQLDVTRLPAREDQIRAQSAQVAAARAAQTQAAWRLDQKRPVAGQAGLVADTLYREGEWVAAGSPVVRLLPPGNVKLRFFVPEAAAGGLKPGRSVNVGCDGCGAGLTAIVSYIANEPEYTPPVIYSNETRAKFVFLVEARPAADNAARLRPGQPVSVTLQ
jgi:HlyD family secretion protein